ncbi:MAG: hypothetical protein Q7Q71_07430 [Verrucomicrobiota bacterium JB023]|nr:hypothetical protein [Verrucomicrobiota bacterium JB023]
MRIFALILLLCPPVVLQAEVEDDLTLGIETVTGIRSHYLYRGFDVADATMDFQIETEIGLGRDFFLGLAGWHAAESSGDFSESAFSIDLHRDWEDIRLTASAAYHAFSGSFLENGMDTGLAATWYWDDSWDIGLELHYDFGAEAFYSDLIIGWSQPLGEDLFLSAQAGVSAAADYYEQSGPKDLHGRLSLTYNINSFLSVTPFTGFSLGLDSEAGDHAYAGLWLAVSF